MKMENKIKIGLSFRREHPPEAILAYAKEAEALGFDEMWVVEDSFFASGVATAAAILASTKKIGVGVGIMPVVARNPVFTAMEIATLGRMFPGRFTAGIGHGVTRWMRQIGAFPPSQLTALREGIEIIQALLAGEQVDVKGKQFQLDNGQLVYVPAAAPPVYLGVRGPKSLVLSGEIADGTILAEFSSPAYVAWARGQIRKGSEGKRAHHITVFVYACACETMAEGREQMRPLVARAIASGTKDVYFRRMDNPHQLRMLQQVEDPHELAARIPAAWIDQTAIIGNRADWERKIKAYANAGADTIVLVPLPELGLDQVKIFARHLFE
jgi:alkanesulfonate monooxygenase SsuD/methylene tetrahydromethanopterin reductase-like flavin-dependent oxidoreductase (luciferase family)